MNNNTPESTDEKKAATLACAIITKDAGPRFSECLASVDWVDEIVVLDSGSSDATVELAERAGAKVFHSDTWRGFGPQRRLAQRNVKSDWILWIDSDEVVTEELRQSIERVMQNPQVDTAYEISRLSDFFGKFMRHSGWYPDAVVRLHAKKTYQYNSAIVHEKLEVPKHLVKPLEGDLLHYTSDDYYDYMQKSLRYANDAADQLYAKGRTTTIPRILASSVWMFFKKYIFQLGFADGRHGLMLAFQSSHYVFNKYFGLWAKQHTLKVGKYKTETVTRKRRRSIQSS